MPFNLIPLPKINGNGANGLVTIECPIGYKYREIMLANIGGVALTPAQITSAQVLVNGAPVWDLTGSDLNDLNILDGIASFAAAAPLVFSFTDPKATDNRLVDMTALNTGQASPSTGKIIHTLQIRLSVAGAGAYSLGAYAWVENSTNEGPGAILRRQRYGFSAAIGENPYNTLDYGTTKNAWLKRLAIKQSAGLVTAARIIADQREVINSVKEVFDSSLQRGGYVPAGNFGLVIDFAALGRGFLPEQMPYLDTLTLRGKDLTLYVTNDNAGSNLVLMDSLGEV